MKASLSLVPPPPGIPLFGCGLCQLRPQKRRGPLSLSLSLSLSLFPSLSLFLSLSPTLSLQKQKACVEGGLSWSLRPALSPAQDQGELSKTKWQNSQHHITTHSNGTSSHLGKRGPTEDHEGWLHFLTGVRGDRITTIKLCNLLIGGG